MGTPDTCGLSIFSSKCVFVIDSEFYRYKVTGGNLPLMRHNSQKIQHSWVKIYRVYGDGDLSINAQVFLYADMRRNSATPRRVALARIFKEAGL